MANPAREREQRGRAPTKKDETDRSRGIDENTDRGEAYRSRFHLPTDMLAIIEQARGEFAEEKARQDPYLQELQGRMAGFDRMREEGLSFRDAARAVGVSPQTVQNWRKKLAQAETLE